MADKVKHWLDAADEDLAVARILLNERKFLHAGFFLHLIVEKALKAVVASATSETPPRIHDLEILAGRGGLYDDLTESQLSLFEYLTPLHIEGRYPEYKERISAVLNRDNMTKLLNETEGFLCWIKQKLEK